MKCKGRKCQREVQYKKLGVCNTHYYRIRRTGRIDDPKRLSSQELKMHRRYNSMIQRCHNPNDWAYESYGGRGIAVCMEWRDSVENYIRDVGYPPTPRHSLDRIDNDKGYQPSNVRWVLQDIQVHNTRSRTKSGYKGVYQFQGKYRASIRRGADYKYLGTFTKPQDAYRAYLGARKELYGY